MDNNAGVLIRVSPGLCRHGVDLVARWLSDVDVTVLKDGGGVAEDEVYGAVYVAVTVELALGVDVQGVLVAFEAAAVEDRVVCAGAECDGLVFLRSGRVFERHVLSYEALAGNTCWIRLCEITVIKPCIDVTACTDSFYNYKFTVQSCSTLSFFFS